MYYILTMEDNIDMLESLPKLWTESTQNGKKKNYFLSRAIQHKMYYNYIMLKVFFIIKKMLI
jgi:hypothetical protein